MPHFTPRGYYVNDGYVDTLPNVLSISFDRHDTDANTNETVLYSYTIPANALPTNRTVLLRAQAHVETAANSNDKTFKIYFGSWSNTLPFTAPASAYKVMLEWKIFVNGNDQRVQLNYWITDGASATSFMTGTSSDLSEDMTAAVDVKITATNGTAVSSDCIGRMWSLEYLDTYE